MKFLVASDLHGSTRAAELILELDQKFNFDNIFLLGDLNYNGARNPVPDDYFPKIVTEKLNSLKSKIYACKGNCESQVDLMVYDFPMPIYNIVTGKNMVFYLTHGDDEELIYKEPKINEFSIYGHTHVPVMELAPSGGYILNPGSMTFPKGKIGKSFIIIDENEPTLYEFDYNSEGKAVILNKFYKKF